MVPYVGIPDVVPSANLVSAPVDIDQVAESLWKALPLGYVNRIRWSGWSLKHPPGCRTYSHRSEEAHAGLGERSRTYLDEIGGFDL